MRFSATRWGAVLACAVLLVAWPAEEAHARQDFERFQPSLARAGRITLGGALGVQAATADGTAFALGLRADYYLNQHISLGPLLQLGVTGRFVQFGMSVQTKYTFDIDEVPGLMPHIEAGLGFIAADLDGRRTRDRMNFLIPFGAGVSYRFAETVDVGTNLLFNFTNVYQDNFFLTWFVGVSHLF